MGYHVVIKEVPRAGVAEVRSQLERVYRRVRAEGGLTKNILAERPSLFTNVEKTTSRKIVTEEVLIR